MDYIKGNEVYRPVVHDGVLNTFINSPNAYSTAVEAVIEAIYFAEVYNEDMYGGRITWKDSDVTRSAENYLRILSGSMEEPSVNTFYIEIQKLENNGKMSIKSKSKAKPLIREQKTEMAVNIAQLIESRNNSSESNIK